MSTWNDGMTGPSLLILCPGCISYSHVLMLVGLSSLSIQLWLNSVQKPFPWPLDPACCLSVAGRILQYIIHLPSPIISEALSHDTAKES